MKKLMVAAALIALPAAAQAMNVAEFLTKTEALKAKGMGAMFSSDLKLVVREFKAAGTAYRSDVDKARAAGRDDLGCPPPKGKAKLTPNQIIADFATVPVAERASTSVKQAFYAMMRRRFPCSGSA